MSVITNLEHERRTPTAEDVRALVAALENAGVEFVSEEDRTGVLIGHGYLLTSEKGDKDVAIEEGTNR